MRYVLRDVARGHLGTSMMSSRNMTVYVQLETLATGYNRPNVQLVARVEGPAGLQRGENSSCGMCCLMMHYQYMWHVLCGEAPTVYVVACAI